jgi:hypothetical protein
LSQWTLQFIMLMSTCSVSSSKILFKHKNHDSSDFVTVLRLTFEFPPTGGVMPTGEFATVKLLRYITEGDYALMGNITIVYHLEKLGPNMLILLIGAEFIFAAMILYYLVEEAMEIKNNKFSYFLSFWNCLDVFVIFVSPNFPILDQLQLAYVIVTQGPSAGSYLSVFFFFFRSQLLQLVLTSINTSQ